MNTLLTALALLSPAGPAPAPAAVRAWEARLGADSFLVRERASAGLARGARRPLLLALARSPDAEVRYRARQALSALAALRAGELASLGPPPMLDSWWYDTTKRAYDANSWARRRLCHYITEATDDGPGPMARYRNASRLWAADALDAGVPPWLIRVWFVELRRRDAAYLRGH